MNKTIEELESEIEQLRVQLAGCAAAAQGAIHPEQLAIIGDYGWSPAYQDVVELRNLVESRANQLYQLCEPLQYVEPAQLRRVAAELVGRGGEYTVCGKALEQLIEIAHPDRPKEPERRISFDQAYGDLTLPL